MEISSINSIIYSIFFIFLGLIGNIGLKLLGCPLQKLLENNIFARQFAYFIVILFTSSFLDDGKSSPRHHFKNAFLVYLFILVFTKMKIFYTIIVFFLILSIYVLHLYIRYYKNKINNKNSLTDNYYIQLNKKLENINKILIYISIIILIIGFTNFLFYKKKEYGNKFDIIQFIFGIKYCKKKI